MNQQHQDAAGRIDPSRVVMATVDTLPEPYEIRGLVEASAWTESAVVETSDLMDLLAQKAAAMGADAVIGVRLSHLTLPAASKERFVGRVTDHGYLVVGIAIGTAVQRTGAGTWSSG